MILQFVKLSKMGKIKVYRTNGHRSVVISLLEPIMSESDINRMLDKKYGVTGWIMWTEVAV